MDVYTIGFTKKNAATFFNFIRDNNVKTLVDVRLNNVSQLAGFAKRDDLKFFLSELCNADYLHSPELAPTKELLSAYKSKDMPWLDYENRFLDLMAKRNIEASFDGSILENACLLCSEHEPHHCHRRLVVEYLNATTNTQLNVTHLF